MSKIAITPEFSIDESDLKDLAWSWYFTTQEIEYISAKNALAILGSWAVGTPYINKPLSLTHTSISFSKISGAIGTTIFRTEGGNAFSRSRAE